MSIGIKELAVLIVVVLLVLEMRRAHRFARNVQTRVVSSTVNTAAHMRRFRWIIGGADSVSLYVIGAICLVACALLATTYLLMNGL